MARRSQEALPEDQDWLRGPPRGLGGARSPPRWAWRNEEALPEGWEGSRRPTGKPGGSGGIGSPYRSPGRGREALQECQEGSGGPAGGLGDVVRPSCRVR